MVSKKEEVKFCRLARKQIAELKLSDKLLKQERFLFRLAARANRRVQIDAECMKCQPLFELAQTRFAIDYEWCEILLNELKEVQDKQAEISRYDADSKWLSDFTDKNWDWVQDSLSEEEFAELFPDIAEDMAYSEQNINGEE